MTPDEIRKIAIQAGFFIGLDSVPFNVQTIEAFAKLVAQHEREACAKVADQISDKYGWGYYGNEVDTADEIAEAIRARGQA
jgi:hypothetical protein